MILQLLLFKDMIKELIFGSRLKMKLRKKQRKKEISKRYYQNNTEGL